MTFGEVKHYVAQRKAIYQRSLAQADKMLQALVSQDPKRLAEAKAIQADYVAGCAVLELKAAEQPAVAEPAVAPPAASEPVHSAPHAHSAGAKVQHGKAGDGGAPVK